METNEVAPGPSHLSLWLPWCSGSGVQPSTEDPDSNPHLATKRPGWLWVSHSLSPLAVRTKAGKAPWCTLPWAPWREAGLKMWKINTLQFISVPVHCKRSVVWVSCLSEKVVHYDWFSQSTILNELPRNSQNTDSPEHRSEHQKGLLLNSLPKGRSSTHKPFRRST